MCSREVITVGRGARVQSLARATSAYLPSDSMAILVSCIHFQGYSAFRWDGGAVNLLSGSPVCPTQWHSRITAIALKEECGLVRQYSANAGPSGHRGWGNE